MSASTTACGLCGAQQNRYICDRCDGVWYCSGEHKFADLDSHRQFCERTNNTHNHILGSNEQSQTTVCDTNFDSFDTLSANDLGVDAHSDPITFDLDFDDNDFYGGAAYEILPQPEMTENRVEEASTSREIKPKTNGTNYNELLEDLLDKTALFDLNATGKNVDVPFLMTSLPSDASMTSANDFELYSESADISDSSGFPAVAELPHPNTFFPPSPVSSAGDSAQTTDAQDVVAEFEASIADAQFPVEPQPQCPEFLSPPPPKTPCQPPVSATATAMPAAMPPPQAVPKRQPTASRMSSNADCSLTPSAIAKQNAAVIEYVVNSLANYGLCVLDGFLGQDVCAHIATEAQGLNAAGLMTDGQISSKNKQLTTKVREDKIAWVEKDEAGFPNISYLISKLDTLVMQCEGRLDRYEIKGRTKAMVACYPGHGTSYLRHVDNADSDGRCITCIYYLNKDWKVKDHGGLLKIYPQKFPNRTAEVEPLYDRVILFWSDYRNPHEVRPSLRTRYAITVWYFDTVERAKFKQHHAETQLQKKKAKKAGHPRRK